MPSFQATLQRGQLTLVLSHPSFDLDIWKKFSFVSPLDPLDVAFSSAIKSGELNLSNALTKA